MTKEPCTNIQQLRYYLEAPQRERDKWKQQAETLPAYLKRIKELERYKAALRHIVDLQALDEGLWFVAETAPEGYLQQELRRLHTAIEAAKEE